MIGGRCTHSNVLSLAVLMVEGLTYIDSRAQCPPQSRPGVPHHRPCSRVTAHTSRGGAVAARRAHNPKVGGSNPSPATNVGRLEVGSRRLDQSNVRPLTSSNRILWWLERGGPTRSHPEHGSETPQRRRYLGSNPLWKIGPCQGIWTPEVNASGVRLFSDFDV